MNGYIQDRMKMGNFFQYLVIELMKASMQFGKSHIKQVFDGTREGDVFADIEPPIYDKGLRLYISVKKSKDTVGGQDVRGQILRIEEIPKNDKNLTSPYLCVLAIATEPDAMSRPYEQSRTIKCKQDGSTYSDNVEVWLPSFIFPYISGWEILDLYREISEIAEEYLPFNTLKCRTEASKILIEKLIQKGIISSSDKKLTKEQFFKLLMD